MIMVLISFLCNFQVTIGTHGKLLQESKSMLVMVHFKHHKFDCIVRISSKLFSCGSIFSCFIFVALFSWLKFKLHASFEPVMYSRINISVLVQAAFHFSEIHSIARFRRHKQIKLLKKKDRSVSFVFR